MRKVLFSSVAAVALGWAAAASAAPMISYQIFDGATLIGSSAAASSTGSMALFGSDADFTISGGANAAPVLKEPNFSTNNFDTILSGAAGVITIKVTTTGLTLFTGGNISNTFTLNSLTAPTFTSGTISNYFDSSNAAYGTATLLGTATYSGTGSFSSDVATSATPTTPFSETTIYTLTFGSGASGSLSSSSQLIATPEPASLGLIGAGLVGLGFIRRRRA